VVAVCLGGLVPFGFERVGVLPYLGARTRFGDMMLGWVPTVCDRSIYQGPPPRWGQGGCGSRPRVIGDVGNRDTRSYVLVGLDRLPGLVSLVPEDVMGPAGDLAGDR
jgi:hypothetical protein